MQCPPRAVFNMPYGLFLTIIAMVITAVSLGHTLIVRIPFEKALDEHGLTATAHITGFSEPFKTRWRARGERSQKIYFRFQDRRGASFRGTVIKNRRQVRKMKVGETFTVRYLPEDPRQHRASVMTINKGHEAVTLSLVGLIFLLGLSGFFIWRAPPNWSGPRLWPILSDDLI